MKQFIFSIVCFLLFGAALHASNKFTIVIDPGHGGKDFGAYRKGYYEKNINLSVALELGKLLEKNMQDVRVIFTRKTDVFIDLNERANIANREKANLFISIHTNSTPDKNTSTHGVATYILGLSRSAENLAVAERENSVILLEDDYTTKYEGFDPNSPESYIIFEFMINKYMEQSLEFASILQKDFGCIAHRKSNGVHQAGFLVLRKTSMPSILIELGFVNNHKESAFLYSESGREKMAKSIYMALVKYKANFDRQHSNLLVKYRPAPDNHALTKTPTTDNHQSLGQTLLSQHVNEKPVVKQNVVEPIHHIDVKHIQYGIQFLYSSQLLKQLSPQLKGLHPYTVFKVGQSYKYIYGLSDNYNEVLKKKHIVKSKFKDAFLVKLINGKRIQ